MRNAQPVALLNPIAFLCPFKHERQNAVIDEIRPMDAMHGYRQNRFHAKHHAADCRMFAARALCIICPADDNRAAQLSGAFGKC